MDIAKNLQDAYNDGFNDGYKSAIDVIESEIDQTENIAHKIVLESLKERLILNWD